MIRSIVTGLFAFLMFINTGLAKQELPAEFINNQIYLKPTLTDGTQVTFFTDTGGGGNAISEDLYNKYKWPTISVAGDDGEIKLSQMPVFKKGKSIPAGGINNFMKGHLFIVDEKKLNKIGVNQGFLGGRWHAEKIIEFNYIKQKMHLLDVVTEVSVDEFDAVKLGFQKDAKGSYSTAFPRININISGKEYPMLFDTGATAILSKEAKFIMKSSDSQVGTSYIISTIFEQWKQDNPSWKVIDKACTLSNEAMIEVPQVTIGDRTVGPVWFTRRTDPKLHSYMSKMMDKKIDGVVGGSLFQYLRIVVDYPNEIAYISDKAR